MYFCSSLVLAAVAVRSILAAPAEKGHTKCKPFSGNFTVDQYQLYPENVDFDPDSCLLYISSLFNATVAIYDPYSSKIVDILTFPGITNTSVTQIGGLGLDPSTGLLSIVANAGAAFPSHGADLSGSNFILQWDPATKITTYRLNLTETSRGRYGGFQDVEMDPAGNVYVVGTYPSSILRVDRRSHDVREWYVESPLTPTVEGTGGLAAKGWMLLSNHVDSSSLLRFDMRSAAGSPVVVPMTPNVAFGATDAIFLPPKYHGTVLLVAEGAAGIRVLRSQDGTWDAAEYLGIARWEVEGDFVTSSTEIGGSLYMVLENFGDPVVAGTVAGARASFPFVDITKEVEKLVGA
ncbi:hypothetical protein BJ875DRAFT_288796 [Amylocarpus encephaloides]|uniref:TRI14-like protein n=1 Tax=Amylocarpus encephaloides TaxID=45428 RepID=A0A9P7YKM6_9HELO|nr:hypothetical protein BJ875DRAFT_288796 [Amylocarpus encephaloides]